MILHESESSLADKELVKLNVISYLLWQDKTW